ncbi:hypothetical protein ACFWZR_25795 [Streptomyces sp. NPDC059017]|uniref:hypothetical protein n=1 Tax=Streptomyces sp. NPDC059017 TaxID=3346700 RepID=UPI0036BF7EBE
MLKEAQWTGDALAKAVNVLAAEAGLSLRYQRPSVAQWLAGAVPRAPVPLLVAEAMSRRLGREVTAEDAGFTGPDDSRKTGTAFGGEDAGEVLHALARLSEEASHKRDDSRLVYALTAVEEMSSEARSRTLWAAARPSGRRIGRAEVSSAEAMLQLLSSIEQTFGGGYVRTALATYLDTVIGSWLAAPSSPVVGRNIYSVAAKLSCLCGFVHFDDEQHGLGLHYYVSGLRLAASAEDDFTAAAVLRGLSVQAYTLGHRRQARWLAEGAARRGSPRVPGHLRAAVMGQQAVTAAAVGDRRVARDCLRLAERWLDDSAIPLVPIGAYHLGSLAHQHGEVALLLGDFQRAESFLRTAIRQRPPYEGRSRALILHKLAVLQLSQGELDAACDSWHQFVKASTSVRSHRVESAVAEMRARLLPYANYSEAASVLRSVTSPGPMRKTV